MLRLQEVKTGLAEAALGEGAGGKLHKLSVKDIKYVCPEFPVTLPARVLTTPCQLFGMTSTKPAGRDNGRGSAPGSGRASPL